jgi:hypothetical protein
VIGGLDLKLGVASLLGTSKGYRQCSVVVHMTIGRSLIVV